MRIGFIGAGNMAQALFRSLIKERIVQPERLMISDVQPDLLKRLRGELGVQIARDNRDLVASVDLVVLAVKPIYAAGVLADVYDVFRGQALVSIVSGYSTETLRRALPQGASFIRVMPNTPALVGEGTSLLCAQNTLSDEVFAQVQQIFGAVGQVHILEEHLFEIATAISGCGPAFFFQIQEAMADAGVAKGLPRDLSYQLVAQTMRGAGQMQLQTGNHPAVLKDAVCSPGGTTIQGVHVFERSGGRVACMNAILRAYEASVAQKEEAEKR